MNKKLQTESFYDLNGVTPGSYKDSQIKRHREKWNFRKEKGFYEQIAKNLVNLPQFSLREDERKEMICMGTRNNWERDSFNKHLSNASVKAYSLDIAHPPKRPAAADLARAPIIKATQNNRRASDRVHWRSPLGAYTKVQRPGTAIQAAVDSILSGNNPSVVETQWRDDVFLGQPGWGTEDGDPWSPPDYIMDFQKTPVSWKGKWDILYSNSIDHAIDSTSTFFHWLDIIKNNGFLILGFDFWEDSVGNASDPCTFDTITVENFFTSLKDVRLVEKFNHPSPRENHVTYYLQKVVDNG